MNEKRRKRVLIAKAGLDGHDRGAKAIARLLKDSGMEVIYTGLHQTPEQIVNTAIQEDVDIIGVSILSGTHLGTSEKILETLKQRGAANIGYVVGGIIIDRDIKELEKMGAAGVFPMGSDVDEIVAFFKYFDNR